MIRFEVDGRVGTITIDRPNVRNAIDIPSAQGIEAALDRFESDPEIWVGIITGAGKVFCSGGDLTVIGDGRSDELATERGNFAGIVRRKREKPLIAACEGPAIAGGAEIALACDLIVATTASWFSFPEAGRGLIAGAGGAVRLPRMLPPNIALELLLTGEPLSAERAHQLGLVNRLCDPGQALSVARKLASRVCENAPLAVRETLALVRAPVQSAEDEVFANCDRSRAKLGATEDFQEGVRAFLEKRKPNWKAR